MAELQFFATEKDHESLVSLLVCKYQARFILDGGPLPNPSSFEDVAEIMKTITNEKHDPRFYVTSPLWTVEPLTISETKHNDGRVRFYVHPREGGPAFDYLARCQRSDPNGQQIVPSWFSDYPTYQSATNNQAKLVRSPEMASAYKDVQRFLSRCGVRTDVLETHKPGPFALKDALAAYANGAWFRVGDWHHVPRMKANKCFQQE